MKNQKPNKISWPIPKDEKIKSDDFYKGFDKQVLTVRTAPDGLERQIMSQLEDFLRDHHNPIVSQLNAEIERLKAEADKRQLYDCPHCGARLRLASVKQAEDDDE